MINKLLFYSIICFLMSLNLLLVSRETIDYSDQLNVRINSFYDVLGNDSNRKEKIYWSEETSKLKQVVANDMGILAYYSVLAKEPGFNDTKDIVWDVGAISSQVITNRGGRGRGDLLFYGVELGGAKFNQLVLELVKADDSLVSSGSPNPMTPIQVYSAIDMAKTFLIAPNNFFTKPFAKEEILTIQGKIADGGKVYGIGTIHNFVAKLYADQTTNSSKDYYTKEEIRAAIDEAIDRSDQYIYDNIKNKLGNVDFVKTDITALILVYSIMDVLGVDVVYPIDVSNTDLIVKSAIDKNPINTMKVDEAVIEHKGDNVLTELEPGSKDISITRDKSF